jgi:SAM-dependent methyltransferase
MYTSIGYFKDKNDDRKVVLNMYRSLKKGGRLIIETMSKEVLARIFQPRGWSEVGKRIILEERKVSEDWSVVKNRWIVIDEKGKHEFFLDLRIYSAVELGDLLRGCGFTVTGVFGSLEGKAYGPTANRLVVIGKKL